MHRAAFIVADARATALRALNYSPEVERLRGTKGAVIRLREVISALGPAYGTVFTRVDCSAPHGIELLSQSDMFGAEPTGRVIRRDSMAKPERHLIRRWQVLIAGAGTLGENELYGRSLIADSRLVGKYVGPDALVITFADAGSDLSLYCYAFLASGVGVRALRATSYGTKILRLRSDMVADLPVPVPDDRVLKRVAALVRTAVEQRDLYASSLAAARRIVEELPAMQEAHALCATRSRRAVLAEPPFRTMSAWNAASDAGATQFLAQKWSARVGDVVSEEAVFRGNRYSRVDCTAPTGVEMVSQRDLFLIRPLPRRVVRPSVSDRWLFVPPGMLAFANAGTLNEGELFGRPMFVSEMFQGMAFSELVLRLFPDRCAELLYAFLSTQVGFRLLRATAFGSKLLYLRPRFIRDLPLPEMSEISSGKIARGIRDAFLAKDAGLRAEHEAIRIVEEEVVPQWLG